MKTFMQMTKEGAYESWDIKIVRKPFIKEWLSLNDNTTLHEYLGMSLQEHQMMVYESEKFIEKYYGVNK